MKTRTLEDLYCDELRDLYDGERQLIKALPKMAKATQNPELQGALEHHLQQTRHHVDRIDKIFSQHSWDSKKKTCKGMKGLVAEEKDIESENRESPTLDAALIGAAQRVEHYEIAGYGTAAAFARRLGFAEDAAVLEETLEEEKQADATLTALAEQSANACAEKF